MTLDAIMRNMYTSPSAEYLQRRATEDYVFGEVRISDFEIKTYSSNEGTFIALLSARLIATLDEVVEAICMTTLPGHDDPMPEWLRKCYDCGR